MIAQHIHNIQNELLCKMSCVCTQRPKIVSLYQRPHLAGAMCVGCTRSFIGLLLSVYKRRTLFVMASGKRSTIRNDVHLSKTLTYVLRHKAVELGFNIDSGGYISADDILSYSMFRRYTIDDIKTAVASSDKQRFSLREHPISGKLQICANQGHSFSLPDLELTPITDASKYPTVVHGTYLKYWTSIKNQGLNRMKRTHVHFAQGEPGQNGVISGMRLSCEVMIFLNLEKALKEGLLFYLSKNGVILCSGDTNGFIPPKYFKQIIKTRPRSVILAEGENS